MTKKKTETEQSEKMEVKKEEKPEPEMVKMFKDDFDAMQKEAVDLASSLAKVEKEAEKQKAKADEMTAQAQRLQAEFDNYRRRTNETNKRVRVDGAIDVLEKILPVIDAIEQAKVMINDQNTLNGLQIIDRQLGDLLIGFNVERIEALGLPFDPNLHNAIMEEEADEEQRGKVIKVYQQGYRIGDRILRHAVVIVGK